MQVFHFDASLAARYGVDNAIMIYNLQYWIEHNEANGRNFYEGRFWTFNSVEAFTKIFKFWSSGQIRRILNSLEKQGIILTGNFNASTRDRTTWYAFTDDFLHLLKSTNGFAETNKSSFAEIDKCNIDSISRIDSNKHIENTDVKSAADDCCLFPRETKTRTSTRKAPETTEPLCLFADSKYYDPDEFSKMFRCPEYAGIDIAFYYNSVADWSASGGKKKKDWIATARNFMRSDKQAGKLQKVSTGELPPDMVAELEADHAFWEEVHKFDRK